ncbi:hypothetical protein [Staphylococcus aureus]|uniref:Uncharacterized protein n=2 Tax=Staphylococcus aureus TaxID=1280 RepID=A0A380DTB4_STAAU|nr:hypothetical protein [Staphylococcus aureus]ETO51386.1 hypothetical protein Y001_10170 [Staphylococcus aureus MUF256]ETO56634.1 hypothetical protein Y003_06040 [Staphylococcus aureus MUM475]EWG57904.1 hypothetical protein Y000_12060 [Staphylococcus aureus MUF168]EWO92696.1 hypothetical protein Q245_00648 [Staphylococcus aureus M1261]EWP96711.1 hypothetical protein Q201_01043 [Staphylococcus aureus M1203]
MMTTDKPKDADILERVKDILNKKERKKIIMARSCKLLRGRVLICVTFCRNL